MNEKILVNKKSKKELLENLEKENFSRKTLSFYKYVKIENPKKMRDFLYENFQKIGILGRIYVAEEGINAQINIPEHNFEKFDNFLKSIKIFKDIPFKIALEEKNFSSFLKLKIIVKEKIVADGIEDKNFDPSKTGEYVENLDEIHNYLDDQNSLVVDMRNSYESEIGHFKSAHIMNVDTFRDQIFSIEKELGEKKDKKVLLYCTGGIRCEKASAWFKYKGFENVKHIKGGIIEYGKKIRQSSQKSRFLGTNFVFDERLGESVTEDIISFCHLCRKNKSNKYVHCKNQACHNLYLSCGACNKKKYGYCSFFCIFFDKIPAKLKKFLVRNFWKKNPNKKFRKNKFKRKYV